MSSTNGARSAAEDIAVIGMHGRFPGAGSVEELWENLKNGVESITDFSEAELRAAGIDPAYMNVPGYVSRGCVIDDIELFDAGFFGYSARDAETMDPQQRVFLEMAWECLEDAGYDSETYPGMIGVFAGSDQSTYLYQIYNSVDLSAYGYGGMMSIGNEKDYVATQVSYKLNLRGPSMAVQTSCSTSLTAVCMACQTLMCGGCDMALAGGVSVILESGFWTRHDRDEKRLGARALGARVELHYLDVPFDELCRRVSARPGPTADAPSPFTRELMTSYVGHFAVPDEQELALFDPPTRSKAE